MALVTITGTIPDTPGDADNWPWRITGADGVTKLAWPNSNVLTFQVESGELVFVRNAISGVTRICSASSNTNLWTFFNGGRPVATADQERTRNEAIRPEIAGSITTLPRIASSNGCPIESGSQVSLTFFTADQDLTVGNFAIPVHSDAAGGSPTLAKVGLYRVDGYDNIDLIAATANTPTLFSSNWTVAKAAATAPVAVKLGGRLAVGVLIVSAGSMPSLTGYWVNGDESALYPRWSGYVNATDLPTHVDASGITAAGRVHYSRITA